MQNFAKRSAPSGPRSEGWGQIDPPPPSKNLLSKSPVKIGLMYFFTLLSFLQQLGVELWSLLWDGPGYLPLLLPRSGERSAYVPSPSQLVVLRLALLSTHLRLRRVPPLHPAPQPRRMGGAGDLLLTSPLPMPLPPIQAPRPCQCPPTTSVAPLQAIRTKTLLNETNHTHQGKFPSIHAKSETVPARPSRKRPSRSDHNHHPPHPPAPRAVGG